MFRDLTYWGAALHGGEPLSFRAWAADALVNIAGLILALVGAGLLLAQGISAGSSVLTILALSLYSAAMVASFLASLVYNSGPWHEARPLLRRLDHAAIYIKIAGTGTPFAAMIATPFALSMLSVVWILALYGASRKLLFWYAPGRYDPLLYLALAWFSAVPVIALPGVAPMAVIWLMLAGGLVYTGGVAIYVRHDWPYARATWHAFVIIAAGCFYAALRVGAPGPLY